MGGLRREAAAVIDTAVTELETIMPVAKACELLGKSRATLHRQRNPRPAPERSEPAARVADLLTDLKITRSHSRPHVSNENPYSWVPQLCSVLIRESGV